MAATPFILFCLVFVIDALFIINFFFVREVKKLADVTDQLKRERADNNTTKDSKRRGAEDTCSTSSSSGDAVEGSNSTATTIDRVVKDILYPMLFDTTFKERNQIRCFAWRRKWSSILFTALLLVGSNMVFTPQILLLEWTMAKPLVESSEPDFCAQGSKLDKLNTFHSTLERMTQRSLAADQTSYLEQLHSALVADVSLYGVDAYTCPDIVGGVPGNQPAYIAQDWHRKQGPFFPGYCGSALEASLQLAQTEQCTKTVCVRLKGPLQAVTWGKRCVDVQVACPLLGMEDDDNDNRSNQEALIDYRSTQLDIMNEKMQAGTGVVFSQEFSDTAATGQAMASQLITKILHQVDIAGTVYTFYAILAFIFPAPLTVFSPSLWASAARFLLGAQKHQFILLSIAMWWLIEYGDVFLKSPTLRLQLNAMLRDPCFIDGDFVALRRDAWYDTCNAMVRGQERHGTTSLDSHAVDLFHVCSYNTPIPIKRTVRRWITWCVRRSCLLKRKNVVEAYSRTIVWLRWKRRRMQKCCGSGNWVSRKSFLFCPTTT